jgi:hypothetical protein
MSNVMKYIVPGLCILACFEMTNIMCSIAKRRAQQQQRAQQGGTKPSTTPSREPRETRTEQGSQDIGDPIIAAAIQAANALKAAGSAVATLSPNKRQELAEVTRIDFTQFQ